MSGNFRAGSVLRSLAALLFVLAAIPAPALAAQAAPQARNEARSLDFDDGWRFALVNPAGITDPTGAYAHAADPGYDDSAWRRVDLPHDWSIELDPTQADGTDSGTGYLPGGLGWYRKTFTLPSRMAGRQISAEFDGVYMDSVVYLNGRQVGAHPYGYTGFAVDLAGAHTDGTPNVLAVKVQNQLPSSRWYSGSGIYRDVHLVVTDKIHVQRHGVSVTTPDLARTVEDGYANVHVRTDVSGAAQVVSTVKDPRGRTVGTNTAGTGDGTATADVRVRHPALWDTGHPNLYTLRTDVVVQGRTVDTVTTTFGIRWSAFTPQGGFVLNGVPTKLQGVDLHHDGGALGAAVTKDALYRQMKIMKSMGVNAFRTSHNPPSPAMVEVCQELGIVMMVEAFDTWRTPKVKYDYGRFFDANSDADVKEMVDAAKNSPAVVLWSIGNEIPDSTSAAGVPMAQRLIADVRSIDTTRPIVMGSDKYRSVPAPGSAQDQILKMLDGIGLNYNTAGSVDALHARYPDKFFFESESSSETSTRGVYQDPQQLNTGENHTPGRRGTSSYDNNLASWTMSGEYGLKKDRDRNWFAGEFLWSGMDYIGEPTPYNVFPVKASFFGAVDTAGFPKDMYYLFQSQWTTRPMVHLLPMNWTDHRPGEAVQVWAYSNADTVRLYLNGKELGARTFDRKTTADGRTYLETTEATHDDKTVTAGPYPGSYTSPNGSAGKLHLTWDVPYAPGTLKAVATRDGKVVATDVLRTAGDPRTVRLEPDRRAITADGKSLSYVTADVVDARGVTVPGADTPLHFAVTGGTLAGLDNGREESAENYKAPDRKAWGGKALAILRSGHRAGPITVTVTGPGLRPASTVIRATGGTPGTEPDPVRTTPRAEAPVTADASYSGAPDTVPAAMLDGVTASGGWSDHYYKAATALLPAFSLARPADWVSVSSPTARTVGTVTPYFTIGSGRALPATITVAYLRDGRYVPVRNPKIAWATETNRPTTITFDPVRTTSVRLDLTSRAPGTPDGFLQIAELQTG
ncbi:glycoside hydrolase family 2 TIM barrel-domain containing protein [Actinomadura sp. DC4]|uniref:glycoside hydrolase family 2 TIM barrel-domain containing protein n=1 Tax=Actinomadura sp. DC4 TaxID=3055069 RepID=UPI0025B0F816|nr:glycoside hydrolase family 2 TIM barrel-domain containing protein [Actinomadura sp. DC4]MDN3353781.1 glycoside hydrolase family 2 TIM barrel-domain containing protein [Actinomadura sp. DC4]